MANKDPLLSAAEFEDRQNNFYLHFVGEVDLHEVGDRYRSRPAYMACTNTYQCTFRLIATRLGKFYTAPGRGLSEHPWVGLYEAYVLMYPFADSNNDLFS